MKKVLVIGENSYIGKSFYAYANDKYSISMVSSRDNKWKSVDFSSYDSVLHCAGIAHLSRDPKMEKQYFEVNCDLAVEVAKKSKSEKVKQFIFLSSILIYGKNTFEIDFETNPSPEDYYGQSKLKAEQELHKISGDDFSLCIIRPPMVYGKGCKGNFPKLAKLAKRMPLFPDYPNKRSMIFIDNLCEFLTFAIDSNSSGIHLPQNSSYVNTTELVMHLARAQKKKVLTTKLFNPIITLLRKHISPINKMFGDLVYAHTGTEEEYNCVAFDESIERSINGNER